MSKSLEWGRLVACAATMVWLAGMTPSVAQAQGTAGPAQSQSAQSLETLLSEIRNAGPETDGMPLALKLSNFIKNDNPDIKPLVLELETNKSVEQRLIISLALTFIHEKALPALPLLIKIAQQEDGQNARVLAVMAIGNIGPKAVSAVPVLVTIAQHGKDRNLRSTTLVAIQHCKPAAAGVLAPMQEIVEDKNEDPIIRMFAAKVLGALGPNAKPAYGAILNLLLSVRDYPDSVNARVVGRSLGQDLRRIDASGEAEAALVALLDKRDDTAVRAAIASALEIRSGDLTPAMTQALIDALLKEDNSSTRQDIARTLQKARDVTDKQAEALAAALDEADEWGEIDVLAQTVQHMGIVTRAPVLDSLSKQLSHPPKGGGSEIASILAGSGDLAAQRRVLEALRHCTDEVSCRNLGNGLARAAPFKPDLFSEMLDLFIKTPSDMVREGVWVPILEADPTLLPQLKKAWEEQHDISANLRRLAPELGLNEAALPLLTQIRERQGVVSREMYVLMSELAAKERAQQKVR